VGKFVVPLRDADATEANRFGPKAANLAALGLAGLPIADGFALDSAAYRLQLQALGLKETAHKVFSTDGMEARRSALAIRLGFLDQPITGELIDPLMEAWESIMAVPGNLAVVRSSALVEDRFGSSFAGQFESFLGIENDTEYLTAIRSCWCALWATRALRYMATHDLDPAETAMGLIIQPLIHAKVSGGGLSRTAEGDMLISATWGLGSAIAQGEVVPDRYRLTRDGQVLEMAAGRKFQSIGCTHGTQTRTVSRKKAIEPCLSEAQVKEIGEYLYTAESVVDGPAEIEWSLDDDGFKLLQARPLHVETENAPDQIWDDATRLRGHPAGVGWGTGRACVVNCECELSRVAPGDVLITKVPGPALAQILPRVSGVIAELGGSTSHLASLARERGIPMVLGVMDATTSIPEGSTVAVDGVAGIVRWKQ
jgi:pyruvate,water dikinase|tara:strand:+ start:382 stop:1659 length:1278 start_codon:yes stop_codon:yes gene_type:complete